jgi:WD40 repeat protein/DNA-binding SARP family transcriptional activator
MARLALSLLGPFQAILDGEPATGFESNKVRALLAFLAVEADRPHPRETLAGLLWPDYPDRSALTNLRSALANLRQAIGDRRAEPPFLLITRDTIQFNIASDYSLDLTGLQNLPGQNVDQLEQTVAAYQGCFLEGFSLGDSALFEEWALRKREQINRQVLDALQHLAAHYEECGDYTRAIAYARRRLELEAWDEDAHRQLMRLLAFSGQRSLALAQYEACSRLLQLELGVEPARETTALYESIRDETLAPIPMLRPDRPDGQAPEPPAPGEPPFKGLSFFDEADADLFFGREALTAQLVARVCESFSPETQQQRVLTVIGASGSGKSSIVRAGLVPALRRLEPGTPARGALRAQPPFGDSIYVITPTAHPLEALAISLTHTADSVLATAALMDDLAHDPRSLHLAAARIVRLGGVSHLLLVVDQFEELFSLCHDEAERKAFVDNLLYASHIPGPTFVVIALRADFYAQCAPFENLRQALCERQQYIGAMSPEELRRAIEEPARRGGWIFEPGLVDLLLREAGNAPGALPLLSHALLETWRRRRGHTLTLAAYQGSGGVYGAIARTAETTFNQLTPEQQAIARNIFVRLTELGEGAGDEHLPEFYTRRRAALSELIPRPEDAPVVQDVLNKLADARLVTTAHETVEVAHEALIQEWARLREWLNERRAGLRLHRQLTEAAQEWERLERDGGMLYRGARLTQAIEWADAHAQDLNIQERIFLEASLAEQQAQQEIEAARQRRELEAAQTLAEAQRRRAEAEMRRAEEQAQAVSKLRRRAVALALVLGGLTVLLLVAVWLDQLANRNARAAQEQARLATSRELAAAAVNNLQVDPERSVLLALHALSTADTLEARNALHQSLPELHILRTIPAHSSRGAPGVAFNPDGARLASIGVDGTAKVWDVASGQQVLELAGPPGDVGFSVAFSPDGKLLATSWTSQVIVWDAATGGRLFSLPGEVIGMAVDHLDFSPDSTRLAVANMDGLPKVWDLVTRAEVHLLTGHTQTCDGIAFSPDGKRLATGDLAGIVKIWDAVTGQELATLEHGGMVHSVTFSPDGGRVASASDNGRLMVWETATGRSVLSLPARSGLYDVTYMPDGKRLVSVHQDGTTAVWDAISGQPLLTLAGHLSTVIAVAASPDNVQVATSGYDGTLKLWDTRPGRELLTMAAHDGPVYGIAHNPDGTRLATASLDGTGKLWDPSSGLLAHSISPDGAAGGLTGVAFSPDGSRVAAGGGDGTVYVDDAITGQTVLTLTGHTDAVLGLAFSPDEKRLVTISWDGTARVWNLVSAKEIVTFTGHGDHLLFGVAFGRDGQHIFTGGDDGYVREWDATTGQELRTFPGEGLEVYGIALSPDGQSLAIGRQDGVVTVWDVSSGDKLFQLSGHAGLILDLAFSQDGTRLVTASFDKFAKVWDAQIGQELMTLYGNTSNVFGVSFSPDGRHVATAGGDGTARIYTLDMDELTELARSRVTRALTTEECRRYFHLEQCPDERLGYSAP